MLFEHGPLAYLPGRSNMKIQTKITTYLFASFLVLSNAYAGGCTTNSNCADGAICVCDQTKANQGCDGNGICTIQ